jgi:hypothetical protein
MLASMVDTLRVSIHGRVPVLILLQVGLVGKGNQRFVSTAYQIFSQAQNGKGLSCTFSAILSITAV